MKEKESEKNTANCINQREKFRNTGDNKSIPHIPTVTDSRNIPKKEKKKQRRQLEKSFTQDIFTYFIVGRK